MAPGSEMLVPTPLASYEVVPSSYRKSTETGCEPSSRQSVFEPGGASNPLSAANTRVHENAMNGRWTDVLDAFEATSSLERPSENVTESARAVGPMPNARP